LRLHRFMIGRGQQQLRLCASGLNPRTLFFHLSRFSCPASTLVAGRSPRERPLPVAAGGPAHIRAAGWFAAKLRRHSRTARTRAR
jgi:hypothetical protein